MMKAKRILFLALFLLMFIFSVFIISGCSLGEKDAPATFSYEKSPVAIYNTDWLVLPLPTDLMNPVGQEIVPVRVPGLLYPDDPPVNMELKFIDADELERSLSYGYDTKLDSDLTLALKKSLNRLDGYVPDYIPDIPFSKKIDLDSLVRFEKDEDSNNIESANFFFLDITDKDNPQIIQSDDYHLIFDIALSDQLPYSLTIRLKPNPGSLMPANFEAGHTYLVVLTGVGENGIKDTDGTPFMADTHFTILMRDTPTLAKDGSPRFNLYDDMEYLQEIEMGRQLINYGLEIWEKIVGDKRTRGEVISSFSFTISSNPMPIFLDPQQAIVAKNPLLPENAAALQYKTAADQDFKPSFKLSQEIELETANKESVLFYKKHSDNSYSLVDDYTVDAENINGQSVITIIPKSSLEIGASYFVAVKNGIKGLSGLLCNADIYFTIVRSPYPLIKTTSWLGHEPCSPFIDNRSDALVSLGMADNPDDAAKQNAANIYIKILSSIDEIREQYQEPINWLRTEKIIESDEDLVLAYLINIEDPNAVDGDTEISDGDTDFEQEPQIPVTEADIGEKNLVDADVTGNFRMYSILSYPVIDDVELFLTGIFEQKGNILAGNATLDGQLISGSDVVSLDEAVSINKDGTFKAVLTDMRIPASFSDMLAADCMADITMEGEIFNSNGLKGNLTAHLKDAQLVDLPTMSPKLEGEFFGVRKTEAGVK